MNWNVHSDLEGQHAFLGASNYHWLRYNEDKLVSVYKNLMAKEEGTWLHDFASRCIQKRIKLANARNSLNMFVNDSISFGMRSEQILKYSNNAFGTTDAISFKDNVLRIFDYKSGTAKASFDQLDIYAALFCLEYLIDPHSITIIQRIYQNAEVPECSPEPDYIKAIMERIVDFDSIINVVKKEQQF